MDHRVLDQGIRAEIATLFRDVFTASEGENDPRRRSVCVAVTYGDPSFYSKTGFSSLSEEVIQAPCKLSLPEGWLGQSLTDSDIPTISQRPACVKQFNNPATW